MATWLLGGLVSASLPTVFLLFTLAVNRFKSESNWVLLPGIILILLFFIAGVIGALIFNSWWSGLIVAVLLATGAIVKELSGGHVEETIVINDVYGTTLDQPYFTQTVKEACVQDVKPQTIQAFCVDVWRGRQIANVVAGVAHEQNPDGDLGAFKRLAYADFLIRTLAVAGTLTAGDLPVYSRSVKQ